MNSPVKGVMRHSIYEIAETNNIGKIQIGKITIQSSVWVYRRSTKDRTIEQLRAELALARVSSRQGKCTKASHVATKWTAKLPKRVTSQSSR